MSSGVCAVDFDYEPGSYQEMLTDLEHLENRLKSVKHGFIPDEDTIGWYLNVLYMEFENCPFCYVKRRGETITIKSHDGQAISDLKEDLKKEQDWLKRSHKMRSKGRRKVPKLNHHFIKCTHVQDSHYKIIFTYNLTKPLVIKGIEQSIDDHKEFIKENREEYDDYPMWEERFKKFKYAWYNLEDALEIRATADDCDKLIKWLEKKAKEVREFRDAEFNQKLPVKPVPKDQAKLEARS